MSSNLKIKRICACRLPAANPAGRGNSPSDEQEESAPKNID